MIFCDSVVRAFHAAYVLPLPFPHALQSKANYFSLAVKLVLFLSVWQLSQRQKKKTFCSFEAYFGCPRVQLALLRFILIRFCYFIF